MVLSSIHCPFDEELDLGKPVQVQNNIDRFTTILKIARLFVRIDLESWDFRTNGTVGLEIVGRALNWRRRYGAERYVNQLAVPVSKVLSNGYFHLVSE